MDDEITPAMIAAGVAAHEACDRPTVDELVAEVFKAMAAVQPRQALQSDEMIDRAAHAIAEAVGSGLDDRTSFRTFRSVARSALTSIVGYQNLASPSFPKGYQYTIEPGLRTDVGSLTVSGKCVSASDDDG